MFAQNNLGNSEELRLKEFIEKELPQVKVESMTEEALKAYHDARREYFMSLPEEARQFLHRIQSTFLSRGIGSEGFITENAAMAKLGYQLLGALDFTQHDIFNFISLENKYTKLRQSLSEQYSGEKLEKRLNELTTAFELSVNYVADQRAFWTAIAIRAEDGRKMIHNQLLSQGFESPFFSSESIDSSLGSEVWKIAEAFASAVQESTRFFAEIVRDFAAENGSLNYARDFEMIEALLRDAGSPNGGFNFDEMTKLREILARPTLVLDSRNEHTGTRLLRSETIFDELARAFPSLMTVDGG
jgi:hypothetical protein